MRVHNDNHSAKTIGGLEVCAPDNDRDEWLDKTNPAADESEDGEDEGVDRRDVLKHIHRSHIATVVYRDATGGLDTLDSKIASVLMKPPRGLAQESLFSQKSKNTTEL